MSKLRVFLPIVVAVMVVAVMAVGATAGAANRHRALRVLVTNDDGVGAPGIAAVVDALQALPNLRVRVVAPATNQSGTGAKFSTTTLQVAAATTASGDAATSVSGFPADTVLYDVLAAHDRPDVVVSGINAGQNLGNITELSGTVGAARTANRLGIPAVAVSQGGGANISYGTAARLTALIVETFRDRFERANSPAQTINVNVPTCPSGTVRGVRLLPLGQSDAVSGYTRQSGTIDNGAFVPAVKLQNPVAIADCTSTVRRVSNDIEGFNNGFATATVLNPDFTDPSVFAPKVEHRWERIDRGFFGH